MRIKVHPLFFVLALALVALGQALAFVWTVVALTLHELGHAAMARARGYVMRETVLMPYGAMMSVNENFDKTSSVLIGIAGPLVNGALALIVPGIWWLFPACYPYTEFFFWANVSLALFNLLPVYPLDGSRVALGLCRNRLRAVKGMQIAGICVSVLFFAGFIASAFFKINVTLGIAGVFLFYGAAFGTKNEMYVSVLDSSTKNYLLGVEKREIKISGQTPIARLYHHVRSTSETTFIIVEADGRRENSLSEADLKKLAVKNRLSVPIGKAMSDGYEPPRRSKR